MDILDGRTHTHTHTHTHTYHTRTVAQSHDRTSIVLLYQVILPNPT